MDNLDVGSIVSANLSFGRHPAIVLSTKKEIADSGTVFVVAISSNSTISLQEDLIEVPHRLGMTKTCYVQCAITEELSRSDVVAKNRKAFGPFLEQVRKQVKIAADRAKKSTSN